MNFLVNEKKLVKFVILPSFPSYPFLTRTLAAAFCCPWRVAILSMFKFYKKQKFKRLQSTLMTAFLVVSLTPLTITAIFFLHAHSQDLQEQSTSHLLSVRETKQQQIADYFEARETEVMGFVRSELAYASGGRFYGLVNAFNRLGHDI